MSKIYSCVLGCIDHQQYQASRHKEKSSDSNLMFSHPEEVDEVSGQVEFRRWTSQQYCEAQLQSQLVPHIFQSLSGQHRQLQRGYTYQQHVATALGALSTRSVYQVLHHGQGLRGYVIPQGRGRGQGHHGLCVLLNQQVAANHHAVQVGMSGSDVGEFRWL